ncbi:MAG: hypothetical protein COA78_12165, partial [Blastopirellula sp.]
MPNPYFTPTGAPATNSQGDSSTIRSEFTDIETGFDKMPALTANYIVVVNAGGTELVAVESIPVVNGGTGTTALTDGGILLGSGTNPVTTMARLTANQMVIGVISGDPVAQSGGTLRTSIGLGTGNSPTFTNITLTGTITGAGILSIDDTTDSTSTATGSIHTDGGLGVVKKVHLNGDLVVSDSNNDNNTKLGVGAGDAITSGERITAFGNNALSAATSTSNCTAVGANTLQVCTGGNNTAIGTFCLDSCIGGSNNTGVGQGTLGDNVSGSGNTAVGNSALINVTGNNNVAIGSGSGNLIVAGSSNIMIGISVDSSAV